MTAVHVRIVSIFLVASFVMFGLTVTAHAQAGGGTEIVYVNMDNNIPFNQQDGESWGTAYQFLQDGLDRADQLLTPPSEAETVEIWVAQGIYRPNQGNNLPQVNDVREHTFRLRNNVAIYGGFTGTEGPLEFHLRDWEQNVTILSGDLNGDDEFTVEYDSQTGEFTGITFDKYDDNSFHVVTAVSNSLLVGIEIDWDPQTLPECIGPLCIEDYVPFNGEECTCRLDCFSCPNICDVCPETSGCDAPDPINSTAVLDGFTIRGGHPKVFTGTGPFPPSAFGPGGGLRIVHSSPTVRNCIISENVALKICMGSTECPPIDTHDGAGVYVNGPFPEPMIFDNVTIRHNLATGNGGGVYGQALCLADGAMHWEFLSLDAVFLSSTIRENASWDDGAGIAIESTIFPFGFQTPNPAQYWLRLSVANSELTSNVAEGNGGAIHMADATRLRLWNSLITKNRCIDDGSPSGEGGGIHIASTGINEIINSTIANNQAEVSGGIHNDGQIEVLNTIIWDNDASTDPQIGGDVQGITVSFSTIEDGWTGSGSDNIDDDPKFVDPQAGNYRLRPESPAINVGDADSLPCDEYPELHDGTIDGWEDTSCGVEFNEQKIPVDLDANARVVGIQVDMGAYEFACDLGECIGDFNQDDVVNVLDLLILLENWGPCEGCPYDLNCDGTVNVLDLLLLLEFWGDCPTTHSAEVGEAVQACLDQYGYEPSRELEECLEAIEID